MNRKANAKAVLTLFKFCYFEVKNLPILQTIGILMGIEAAIFRPICIY